MTVGLLLLANAKRSTYMLEKKDAMVRCSRACGGQPSAYLLVGRGLFRASSPRYLDLGWSSGEE
jgi:hypothetical protein